MEPATLNLRHLRALKAVHQTGSITRAADLAFLSQPAITQGIAKLERAFGAKLFLRGRSGMAPTPAGHAVAHRVERAMKILADGCLKASQRAKVRRDATFDLSITAKQLRALDAMARHGSFSAAARDLRVAQPSVHRVARELEHIAGFPLYEKTSAGIALTPSARLLNRAAKLTFAELRQAIDEVRSLMASAAFDLIVGSLPVPRAQLLPEAIARLTAEVPDTVVRVVDGPYADLLEGLREGDLDMIVGALRAPAPDDVEQIPLFMDRLGIFCGPHHPLAGQAGLKLADLAGFGWVVPRRNTPTRAIFDAVREAEGLSGQVAIVETSSMILVRGLLNASDRLTMLSQHQAAGEVRAGHLRLLDLSFEDLGRPIGISVREGWSPTPTQTLFMDQLHRAARAYEDSVGASVLRGQEAETVHRSGHGRSGWTT
jgi:LysR family transcriptional regulator of gallate degradation